MELLELAVRTMPLCSTEFFVDVPYLGEGCGPFALSAMSFVAVTDLLYLGLFRQRCCIHVETRGLRQLQRNGFPESRDPVRDSAQEPLAVLQVFDLVVLSVEPCWHYVSEMCV